MHRTSGDFPENLRLLCSHYDSVADLCRRMRINRQQFNKYLSGTYLPAARNLRRLGGFFGIEESAFFLPHAEFARTVLARPGSPEMPPGIVAFWRSAHDQAGDAQARLARYCGYYHLHFRSPAWPKSIIRSLALIHQHDNVTYIRNIERLAQKSKPHLGSFVCKYAGVVLMMGERLFSLDRPDAGGAGLSMMVFYASQRRKIALLHGLLLAVTGGSGRQVYSSRAVMMSLGDRPDLRSVLGQCGVYPAAGGELDPEICEAVTNDIDPKSGAMLALEI